MIKNIEAKAKKEDDNRAKILGVGVNSTSAFEVLTKIEWLCKEKSLERPYFIITAYSENVMEAARDKELAKAFCLADLVVPDGLFD
jgi:UDP-N-acetyl-D-mannosaminuronic acid transferase (WecB/TagA/CpsF family)